MGTKSTKETLDEGVAELQQLADEIQVKLHLAGMSARDTWQNELEPKLFEARGHARDAKDASAKAVADAVRAFRAFSALL